MTRKAHDIEMLAAQHKQKRGKECLKEIQRVLKQHHCELRVAVQIGPNEVPIEQVLNTQSVPVLIKMAVMEKVAAVNGNSG